LAVYVSGDSLKDTDSERRSFALVKGPKEFYNELLHYFFCSTQAVLVK